VRHERHACSVCIQSTRWRGPDQAFANWIYAYLRAQGWTELQANIAGDAASWPRGSWSFVRKSAQEYFSCCKSYVNKVYRRLQDLGLMHWRWLGKGEIPPGWHAPLSCGGALRTIVGRSKPDYLREETFRRTSIVVGLDRTRRVLAAKEVADRRATAAAEVDRRRKPAAPGDLQRLGSVLASFTAGYLPSFNRP
jgi:hypothetical protein